MNDLGWTSALVVDGIFGPKTEAAVGSQRETVSLRMASWETIAGKVCSNLTSIRNVQTPHLA
ncbi:peptidoglycan-binding protein [Streptomyces sp. NPDC001536]|uniref:peptidoglycan-binding domain-containing protein n=1 Tax=Streptomyces sp. NPDC001536 TaxID=3364583 RepID=UPI0036C67977